MTHIFLVYSHEDEEQMEDLRAHLSVFERSHNVQVWYDGKIEAGKDWEIETQAALRNAGIVLLVVSAHSIADDACYAKMEEALRLHDQGKVETVPVVLKACLWQDTPLGKYAVLPDRDLAIVDERWESADEPYHRMMKALSPIVAKLRTGGKPVDIKIEVDHFHHVPDHAAAQPWFKQYWYALPLGILLLGLLLYFAFSNKSQEPVAEAHKEDAKVFKDPRDGQEYPLVDIGGTVWMAKNLNYTMDGSFCYSGDPANCDKYGRLYIWNAATRACPKGFHLATYEEWKMLAGKYGGPIDVVTQQGGGEAYNALISGGVSGFNGKLGGFKEEDGYKYQGRYGYYWTATPDNKALSYAFFFSDRNYLAWVTERIDLGYSCRCVKD